MTHPLENQFKRLDRDVNALGYVLMVFICIAAFRACLHLYAGEYDSLSSFLGPSITLLATLLGVRIANRLITNGEINRENDRRHEIVQTTHHLIAITSDLRQRVAYLKKVLHRGGDLTYLYTLNAEIIEKRYEVLLERSAYKFLPGQCVDIIVDMAAHIFGIGALAERLKSMNEKNETSAPTLIPSMNTDDPASGYESLLNELDKLLDELFKLRKSIEQEVTPAMTQNN